jgi:hypothetical protein
MSMIRCKADEHYYDDSKYQSCPYCRDTATGGGGARDKAEPTERHASGRAADEVTHRGGGGRSPDEETRRMPSSKWASEHSHRPSQRKQEPSTVLISGRKGSPAASETKPVAAPTVGWLVIVEGPGKGADLAIRAGQNRIGRARTMDLVLDHGDTSISSENHALLVYDYQNNQFFVRHGEGKNLTYLNAQPVLETKPLAAFDRIKLGSTELVFVPFCGDRFSWDS